MALHLGSGVAIGLVGVFAFLLLVTVPLGLFFAIPLAPLGLIGSASAAALAAVLLLLGRLHLAARRRAMVERSGAALAILLHAVTGLLGALGIAIGLDVPIPLAAAASFPFLVIGTGGAVVLLLPSSRRWRSS